MSAVAGLTTGDALGIGEEGPGGLNQDCWLDSADCCDDADLPELCRDSDCSVVDSRLEDETERDDEYGACEFEVLTILETDAEYNGSCESSVASCDDAWW